MFSSEIKDNPSIVFQKAETAAKEENGFVQSMGKNPLKEVKEQSLFPPGLCEEVLFWKKVKFFLFPPVFH